MVKSTETETEQGTESSISESKVEKTIETALQNTSNDIIRWSEKGSKEGSDEDGEHVVKSVENVANVKILFKEPGMRVGDEYQAVIPEMSVGADNTLPEPLQVWAPNNELDENKLENYLQAAKDKHGYNVEQALGMLYWHKFNFERSLEDLSSFTPLPDEWSMEDKVIFEQSFNSHGKHFSKIRAQLPDKNTGSLVKYYYSWKKTRNRTSLMDRQARRQNKDFAGMGLLFSDGESDGADDDTSDSDFEPEKESANSRFNNMKNKISGGMQLPSMTSSEIKPVAYPQTITSTTCANCSIATSHLTSTPRGQLCNPCFDYWSKTGVMRPKITAAVEGGNINQLYKGPQAKLKKRPPKGMHLNGELLHDVSQVHGDGHVRPLEIDLISLRRQVQAAKQGIGQEKQEMMDNIDRLRPPEPNQKMNARWTNEELLMAVQCVRKYGKDFQAMAEVLGNKNVSQCRNFFVNYRRRFNLLDVLEEYEKEHSIVSDRSADTWDDVTMSEAEPFMGMSSQIYPPPRVSIASGVSGTQPPPLCRPTDPNGQPSRPVPMQTPGQRPNIGMVVGQGPPPLVNNPPAAQTSS
eukprot:gene17818-19596_t